MATIPEAAAVGRPSDYTEALAETICDMLMDGLSMRKICQREEIPHRSTVLRWLATDKDFAAKCAHAREFQAEIMDDKILETADACTPETAAADRVKIAAYQWRASKLAPKKYGDKIAITGGGADDHPVRIENIVTEIVLPANGRDEGT